MTIGIPRYMFYHEYCGIFNRFLINCGITTFISPLTDAEIFRHGKEMIIDEFCYPVKIYCGHVRHLAESDVEMIFVPIIIGSNTGDHFLCFNKIRMYDIVRNLGIVQEERILSAVFRYSEAGLLDDGFFDLGKRLGIDEATIGKALEKARNDSEPNEITIRNNDILIGLTGKSYLCRDVWTSMNIEAKLNRIGCDVITRPGTESETHPRSDIPMHFTLSTSVLNDIMTMNDRHDIDGIIYLLPFNCGPDCGIEIVAQSMGMHKPFMTIVIDELTGDAGITTRLEAFVDMVKNRYHQGTG